MQEVIADIEAMEGKFLHVNGYGHRSLTASLQVSLFAPRHKEDSTVN